MGCLHDFEPGLLPGMTSVAPYLLGKFEPGTVAIIIAERREGGAGFVLVGRRQIDAARSAIVRDGRKKYRRPDTEQIGHAGCLLQSGSPTPLLDLPATSGPCPTMWCRSIQSSGCTAKYGAGLVTPKRSSMSRKPGGFGDKATCMWKVADKFHGPFKVQALLDYVEGDHHEICSEGTV